MGIGNPNARDGPFKFRNPTNYTRIRYLKSVQKYLDNDTIS